MSRAHVLIVRRAKLYYTVSGIITHKGGRPVLRLREDSLNLCTGQFCPPDDEHMCSKHVEAWNKLIIKFIAPCWLLLINKYIEMYGQQIIKKKSRHNMCYTVSLLIITIPVTLLTDINVWKTFLFMSQASRCMYKRNSEAGSRKHCCCCKANRVIYSVCVCLCVCVCSLSYAGCKAHASVIMSSVARLVLQYFSKLSHKRHEFR